MKHFTLSEAKQERKDKLTVKASFFRELMSYSAACSSERVPTLQDGNSRENIFNFPWRKHRPIVLGPRFRESVQPIFEGHVHLHIIRSSTNKQSSAWEWREDVLSGSLLSTADLQAHVVDSYKMISALYIPFKNKVKEQGWVMSESLLNPGRAPFCEN